MCEPSQLDDVANYTLTMNSIFIAKRWDITTYPSKIDNWNCENCLNVCKMKSTFHKIAYESDNCFNLKVSHFCLVEYSTILLDEELAYVQP